MRKYKLEITVFLCGALGMVLELVAARVLSPYVGSSNLIWTTIIGIMLTSMSIGYWLGGKQADKNPEISMLSNFILLAAIFTSLIPILETVLVKNLSNLSDNLILVAIISATILFGVPSFVLATVSPFAVKLKDKEHETIGQVSGKISSLSTIGSIVGTFTAGFLLIPNLGVRTIVFITILILLLLAIWLFPNKNKKYISMVIIISVCIFAFLFLGRYIFEKENPDIIKDVDSEYSRIWVKQVKAGEKEYKTLQVDTGLESYIDNETGKMGAGYLYYYDLFDYYNKDAKNILMIGGAAYTYPTHFLKKYDNKTIDVSEIDSKMTELATEQFGLDIENERLNVYHQDGRTFLNKTKNKYDCILLDAFKGLNAPFELTTYEAMQNAKNILNENGMIITNIISSLEGAESDFIKYEYSTYKAVFDDVKLFKVKNMPNNERQNLILVGFKGNTNIDEEKLKDYELLLNNEVKDFTSDKKVVTDNYAPIGG